MQSELITRCGYISYRSLCDMCHEAHNRENHKSSKHTSEGVYTAHNDRIPAEKGKASLDVL